MYVRVRSSKIERLSFWMYQKICYYTYNLPYKRKGEFIPYFLPLILQDIDCGLDRNLQKMLIFEIDALPKLQKGGGVQLIKIKKDDFLSDVTQLTIEDGLEWSTGSKNRKLEDVEFWIGKRAQAGKKVPKFFNKNQKFDG